MKTVEEIKEKIKQEIKFSWEHGTKESRKFTTSFCNGLLWSLFGYQNASYCPYCGEIIYCDEVDIGIGYQQCGPYHCENCGASEIHPNDTLPLDEDEQETGFYKNRISPIANQTNDGKLVNHKKALELYPFGMLKNCKPNFLEDSEDVENN
jgi:hypothetical protein